MAAVVGGRLIKLSRTPKGRPTVAMISITQVPRKGKENSVQNSMSGGKDKEGYHGLYRGRRDTGDGARS